MLSYDDVRYLPRDPAMMAVHAPPSQAESDMINQIMYDHQMMAAASADHGLAAAVRRLLIPAILFFVMGLKWTDDMLRNLFPTTSGMSLLLKTGIFLALLFIADIVGLM